MMVKFLRWISTRNRRTDYPQHPDDAALTQEHLTSKLLDFQASTVARKVKTLTGDSIRFDFSPWKESIDLAFIDGGHDLITASSDTQNALTMINHIGPSCVIWHDYRNSTVSGIVLRNLDELSQQMDIFHIEDTMLCVHFQDSSDKFRSHLLS